MTDFNHHFFLSLCKKEGRKRDRCILLARLVLCKGIKRHKLIHCQHFFGYISKIVMLIILIFILFPVSMSLFFHKCRVPCPYLHPYLNQSMSVSPDFLDPKIYHSNIFLPNLKHIQIHFITTKILESKKN